MLCADNIGGPALQAALMGLWNGALEAALHLLLQPPPAPIITHLGKMLFAPPLAP